MLPAVQRRTPPRDLRARDALHGRVPDGPGRRADLRPGGIHRYCRGSRQVAQGQSGKTLQGLSALVAQLREQDLTL